VRLDRSHSRKVSWTPGDADLILVMRSLARVELRPEKKIRAGFLAAMRDIEPAPKPVVPDVDVRGR
jgi:hypothetical protein